MKILGFSQGEENSLLLNAVTKELEFRHLKGYTDHICMFAENNIDQPTRITKTGARHNLAKWFLIPINIRAKFSSHELDYTKAKVGYITYNDSVFFIYQVGSKSALQR